MKIYKDQGTYSKKDKCYHFFNNTYEFNLYIFFDKTFKKATEYIGGEYDGETKAIGKCFYNSDTGHTAIWFPNRRPQPETIAHESLHAVNFILDSRGVEHDVENDEPYTYLLSWFIKCINTCK